MKPLRVRLDIETTALVEQYRAHIYATIGVRLSVGAACAALVKLGAKREKHALVK